MWNSPSDTTDKPGILLWNPTSNILLSVQPRTRVPGRAEPEITTRNMVNRRHLGWNERYYPTREFCEHRSLKSSYLDTSKCDSRDPPSIGQTFNIRLKQFTVRNRIDLSAAHRLFEATTFVYIKTGQKEPVHLENRQCESWIYILNNILSNALVEKVYEIYLP